MRLARVILFTEHLPRLRAFYRDVLGLAPLGTDGDDGWFELDAGAASLALHAIPAAHASNRPLADPPVRREDSYHKLAFHTDDVEARRAELIALGVPMDAIHRWGAIAYCDGLDPEGNVFQITGPS